MSEVVEKLFDKKKFIWATVVSIIVGIVPALVISRETSGYVAGMAFGYLVLFCGLPLILILIVVAIGTAIENKAKYTTLLLMSCILIPVSFVVSLKIMEATGIAVYKRTGVDEMRPLGSELNERIFIAFKESASSDEIHKFDETVLRKSIPQPNGVMLAFADGICRIMYPNTEFKQQVADIGFCNGATIEQKKKIKEKANSSPIVFRVFDAVQMEEIKNLQLPKKDEIPENIQRKAILKTVANEK